MSRSDPTTIDGFIRTAMAGLMVAGIGYAGGWVFSTFSPNLRLQQTQQELMQVKTALDEAGTQLANQRRVMEQMGADLEASQRRIDQLSTSLRLLKIDRRVAEITVLRQEEDPQSGGMVTEFVFQEVGTNGIPVDDARSFRIAGDMLYVDFWVVKFNDELVEMAAPDKSTSICLFRRLFGEFQEPHEGYTLDQTGVRPIVYGHDQMSAFEREIWSRFWEIAAEPDRAAQLGVRAAHGEAVATKLRRGQKYRVTLRASDGLSITPVRQAVGETADDLSVRSMGFRSLA